jgi:hypothetical protein
MPIFALEEDTFTKFHVPHLRHVVDVSLRRAESSAL